MGFRKYLRLTGIIMFVVGLFVAGLIYRAAAFGNANEDASLPKRDVYQIEKLGGKEYVLGVEMNAWFTGLWHGRRLAYTVLFLSGAGCIGCFLLADFLDRSSKTPSKFQNANS